MADRLAKIFGTEEDKVNCPFYFKIGACRHGDTCTRHHNKPPLSQTMVFSHLYENPPAAVAFSDGQNVPEAALVDAVNHFEDFYEEVFMELAKYGEIEEMAVADNIGDHMIGNVYTKFITEEQAKAAMQGLNGRYYSGRTITCEYSPVTDFREAKCRQYNDGQCDRGGFCNFMHPKHVSRDLKRQLNDWMYSKFPEYRESRRKRKNSQGQGTDYQSYSGRGSSPTEQHRHRQHRKSRSRSPHNRHSRDYRDRGDGDRRNHYESKRSKYDDRRRRNSRSRSKSPNADRSGHQQAHQQYQGNSRRREGDRDRGDRDRDNRGERRDHYRSSGGDYRRGGDRDFKDHYKKHHRRSNSRDRDNHNSENHGQRMARMTSEERRKMIAGWGQEDEQRNQEDQQQQERPSNLNNLNQALNKEQAQHEEQKEDRPQGGDLSNPEYQVKQQTN